MNTNIRRFWDRYAPHYKKIILSPVYQDLIKDMLVRAAIHKRDRCLDLGCGPGYLALEMVRRGAEVWAIDYSRTMITYAREVLGKECDDNHAVHLVAGDANDFLSNAKRDGRSFDVIVASLLVSYLTNRESLLQIAHDVLSENGRFVMSNPVPNPRFWKVFRQSGLKAFQHLGDALWLLRYAREIKRFEKEGIFRFFDVSETQQLLLAAGFQAECIEVSTGFAGTVYVASAVKHYPSTR